MGDEPETRVLPGGWHDRLNEAIRYRESLGFGRDDAFRLLDGDADGIPGIAIDCYAGHWVAQSASPAAPAGFAEGCREHCQSLWWKHLSKGEKGNLQQLAGAPPAGAFPATENEIRYLIDFSAGYSQGIFLDQRLNRQRVQELCRNKPGMEVLNLFAYTCGFSVAAASAGAKTTSIDLSPNYLDWGKRNFSENGIDPEEHEFLRGDTFSWLRRLTRRERKFDLAIVDPPTFSRGEKGKTFRVSKDFGSLAAAAAATLRTGGWMLCSANTRSIRPSALEESIIAALGEAGLPVLAFSESTMPPEFTGDRYLIAFWLQIG